MKPTLFLSKPRLFNIRKGSLVCTEATPSGLRIESLACKAAALGRPPRGFLAGLCLVSLLLRLPQLLLLVLLLLMCVLMLLLKRTEPSWLMGLSVQIR